MGNVSRKVGAALRFVASDGMADADPAVLRQLLSVAQNLATATLNDASSSPELRAKATAFLEQMRSDTYDTYEDESNH